MTDTFEDDATLSVVAHNLRGAIGLAAGAARTVRMRWDVLDADRRDELLELAERGMARVDDAVFGIARGLPAEIIADLQRNFDREESERTDAASNGDPEVRRLAALHRYHVIGQPPSADLDAVCRLAAHLTGTPVAVINLMDADKQYQVAAFGTEPRDVARDQSMCARTIIDGETIVVCDSSVDPRYADSPWVNGEYANVRLYAAAPLIAPVDNVVGTLCVFDERTGTLRDDQVTALEDLAQVVTALFEQRAVAAQLREAALAQHELITDLERERRRNDHLLERLGAEAAKAT
jgi:GAF domain-containing protein